METPMEKEAAQEVTQGQTAPPQEPQSKEDKLAALESELSQCIESLEGDFARKCAKECEDKPELEELFFEDKVEFFSKILELQNEFINQELKPRQEAVENMKGDIALDNSMQAIEAARQEFQAQNPDIDTNELLGFMLELPEEIQAELEKLPPKQIFPALLELKKQAEGGGASEPSDEPSSDLPRQVSGAPASVSTQEVNSDLPTQRF